MNAKEAGLLFLSLKNKETPITCEFDKKYGQKNNRWWVDVDDETDGETYSKQRIHVAVHFLCWYYCFFEDKWKSPTYCKLFDSCAKCYYGLIHSSDEDGEKCKDCKDIYEKTMIVPEIFIWIYEALELKNKDELVKMCEKYKDNRYTDSNDKIPWEQVEEKLRNIE